MFKIQEIKIDDNTTFEDVDKLDRTRLAEHLTKVLSMTEVDHGGVVLCLNADWGEGKTTFIKLWRNYARKQICKGSTEGLKSIYFDAFENDYSEEPFIDIVSAFDLFLKEDGQFGKIEKDFINKAINVSEKVFSLATGVGLKLATLGLLGHDEVAKSREIAKELVNSEENWLNKKIRNYINKADVIKRFKLALECVSGKIHEETGYPLVLIIDELDRCKPLYALSLIERVKHFFSVKDIVFVLVMNKKQLENSVRYCYGSKIEASSYLQKFIDYEFQFPKPKFNYGSKHYKDYTNHLFGNTNGEISGFFLTCAENLKCSLREMQQIFIKFKLWYKKDTTLEACYLSLISLFLCSKNEKWFLKIKNNEIEHNEIDELIAVAGITSSSNGQQEWFRNFFSYFFLSVSEYEKSGYKPKGNNLSRFSCLSRESLLTKCIEELEGNWELS